MNFFCIHSFIKSFTLNSNQHTMNSVVATGIKNIVSLFRSFQVLNFRKMKMKKKTILLNKFIKLYRELIIRWSTFCIHIWIESIERETIYIVWYIQHESMTVHNEQITLIDIEKIKKRAVNFRTHIWNDLRGSLCTMDARLETLCDILSKRYTTMNGKNRASYYSIMYR